MKVKDSGLVVEDDYTNIEKLIQENIISLQEGELLKEFNGMRNAIVHKYHKLDRAMIKDSLDRVAEFVEVIIKIARFAKIFIYIYTMYNHAPSNRARG